MSAGRRTYLLLGALVALGAALRLYGLDHQSLWNDELSSIRGARPSPLDLVRNVPSDHVPGYLLLLHFWMRWIGDSETALRLPSALCGIATIPAMFALGRRCYGEREGLLAAGLTAVSWMPLYYSQEARPYALLLLFVVLSLVWLTDIGRALRAGVAPPPGALAGYVIAATGAASTHYFGLLAVAIQAAIVAVVLARDRCAIARAAALYGAVLLTCAPALYLFAHRSRPPGWLIAPTPEKLWNLFVLLLHQSRHFAWLVLALWAVYVLRAVRRPSSVAPATWLLVAWTVLPIAVAYAYSFLVAPVFLYRALIIVVPAFYLLIARAVIQLPLGAAGVGAVSAGVVGGLLFQLVAIRAYFTEPVKAQFREAAAALVARDTPEAPAVVVACAWDPLYFDYYLERLGSARRVDRLVKTGPDANIIRALIDEHRPRDVWLLAGHRSPDPELLDALADDLTLIEEVRLLEAAVWHYRPLARGGVHEVTVR